MRNKRIPKGATAGTFHQQASASLRNAVSNQEQIDKHSVVTIDSDSSEPEVVFHKCYESPEPKLIVVLSSDEDTFETANKKFAAHTENKKKPGSVVQNSVNTDSRCKKKKRRKNECCKSKGRGKETKVKCKQSKKARTRLLQGEVNSNVGKGASDYRTALQNFVVPRGKEKGRGKETKAKRKLNKKARARLLEEVNSNIGEEASAYRTALRKFVVPRGRESYNLWIASTHRKAKHSKDSFIAAYTAEKERFYNESWGGENFDHKKLQAMMPDDPDKWRVIEADLALTAPFEKRRRCFKCREFGHFSQNCNKKRVLKKCFRCGFAGHKARACPDVAYHVKGRAWRPS